MQEIQVNRIIDCNNWVIENSKKYEQLQSLTILIEDSGKLVAALAFINNQVAIAKRVLNEKKAQEYLNLIASLEANNKNLSPMLMKDYISAKCSKAQYNYDLADRCRSTIQHTLDTLRTCISALKVEIQAINYNQ